MIRDINNNLVLETIIEKAPISRAELSKELGLTKATISSIVQDLINRSLVVEIGSGDTVIGRKPTMLTLNKKAGFSVCIDLNLNKTDLMITGLLGNKLYTSFKEYNDINTFDVIEMLGGLIDGFLDSVEKDGALRNNRDTVSGASVDSYGIIGITIAIHGVVYDNKILFTPYYNLDKYDFTGSLSKKYNTPVYLFNQANLSVLGENTFSAYVNNIAKIGIYSGIGVGMILSGRLYTGANGYAGEFGHTIIELDGRPCPCGNRGCLEQYGSQRALLNDLANMKGRSNIGFDEFSQLYVQKDTDAVAIANQFVKIISAGINNLLNLYNPEIIIINSKFTNSFPDLLNDIKSNLNLRTLFDKKICLTKLPDDAVLYGAAHINIVKFLKIERFNPCQFPVDIVN